MKPHYEGSSFPNFRSSHLPELIPSAPQSVPNASAYTLVSEQQHPLYISSQCSSHDSMSRFYTNDTPLNQAFSQTVATSYPESSQRTILHNSPYTPDYDARDFQRSDIGNNLDRISSDFISTVVHSPPVSEADVHHYRQDTSPVAPSYHHLEYGLNSVTVGDQLSHLLSCELTYSNRGVSRAPATASKRRGSFKATQLHARHHPVYGPEDLHPGNVNRDSAQLHDFDTAIAPSLLSSIPMSNNPGESQAPVNASHEQNHYSSDCLPSVTSDRESLMSVGSHEAMDEFSSSSVLKKRRSKMHECEVCGKKFPRYVFINYTLL